MEERQRKGEARLFFRRWLAHPMKVGALLPSSARLGMAIAKTVHFNYRPGEYVVELGPGTGAVTRALIESGIPEDRLILVERDPDMADWLRDRFGSAQILHSDANRLDKTLSEHGKGKVLTVISSLPLSIMSDEDSGEIVNAIFESLEEGGRMIQYTYRLLHSPFSHEKFGLLGKRHFFGLGEYSACRSVVVFSRRHDR